MSRNICIHIPLAKVSPLKPLHYRVGQFERGYKKVISKLTGFSFAGVAIYIKKLKNGESLNHFSGRF